MKGVTVARPQSTTRSNSLFGKPCCEAYRLTDSLSGKPYCKVMFETAAKWVEQDLARWCKGGEAIQLTEGVAEPSVAESAITNTECEANAGAAEMDDTIAAARRKVEAWPLVGVDPEYGDPTRAPLPTEPGASRTSAAKSLRDYRPALACHSSVQGLDQWTRFSKRTESVFLTMTLCSSTTRMTNESLRLVYLLAITTSRAS